MSFILVHLLFGALVSVPSTSIAQVAPPRPTTPEAETSDADHLRSLIHDLGGDPARSEAARKELLRRGKAAEPYLREAERDPDPARAEAARNLLRQMRAPAGPSDQGPGDVTIVVHDWSSGMDFVRDQSGRITLTVPEKNADPAKAESKTYRAQSLEEFTRKYPDVAKKYHVRMLANPHETSEAMRQAWEHLREAMSEGAPAGDQSEPTLENWLDREERFLEKRREAWPGADGSSVPSEKHEKPSLGVLVGAAGETLRSQLGLGDSGAVVIHSVRPGSLAERSGLKKHDVVTRLNGRPMKDVASFREEVAKAIASDHFRLDVLRGGKPQEITVRPTPERTPEDQKSSD